MRPIRTATSLALTGLVAALLSLVAAPVLAAPFTNTPGSGAARTAFGAAQGSEDSPDDGADHAEMEMTDTEMAEEGHDLDGADHAEDAEDATGATGDHEDASTTHDDTGAVTPSRPRALVLTTFLIVNAGVLGAAALLRRRDRDKPRHSPRPATSAAPTAHPA